MTSNLALYRLLVQFGAPEAEAERAAQLDVSDLATTRDVHVAIAELETRLTQVIQRQTIWMVSVMVTMTGLFALIVGWLTRHP